VATGDFGAGHGTAFSYGRHLLWGANPGSSDPQLGVPDSGAGSAFHEHAGSPCR
jgi:hypothetical protein